MNKVLSVIVILLVSIFISCKENSTNSEEKLTDIDVNTNYVTIYHVYQKDFLSDELGEFIYQKEPIYGFKEEFEGKNSFSFRLIELENRKYLFSKISTDDEGVYLYIPELDMNNLVDGEKLDTNLSRFTPGWIKVYDYNNDSWVANELNLTNNFGIDTLRLKLEILGTHDGKSTVSIFDKKHNAFGAKLVFELEADVITQDQNRNYNLKSNMKFQFINNVGIYSMSFQKNQLFPTDKDIIYLLKGKYGV